MPTLQYQITLGSTHITPTSQVALVSLSTEADLAIPVNTCRLVVANPPTLAVGDVVEVKLGYDQALQLVFKGEVAHLNWAFEGLEVEAVSHLRRLTTTYLNLLFEKSIAKAIATDVAKRCQVSVGKAEDGIQFPVYALGDQTSAYGHLRHLAEQCGFDLYGDRTDKLVFVPYKPSQTHDFTYGLDILAYHWSQRPSPLSGVDVYGESPASQGQGEAIAQPHRRIAQGLDPALALYLLRFQQGGGDGACDRLGAGSGITAGATGSEWFVHQRRSTGRGL